MGGRRWPRKLLSRVGASCPLCGARITSRTYFCARCGRSGRLHLDPAGVRQRRREIYIPRELVR